VNLDNARAITVHPPWSYAITNCGKTVENRPFVIRCTDTLLIHAGLQWQTGAMATFNRAGAVLPPDPVRGAVVAVATVARVCEESRYGESLRCDCGPWAALRSMHWHLADVQVLDEPVPCSGKQGLWNPKPETLAAVKEQIK
jgi:hypothetical protein